MERWYRAALLVTALLKPTATDTSGVALEDLAADAVISASLPGPVSLPDWTPALQRALWRRNLPIDCGPLVIPPEDLRTVLLAGALPQVVDSYMSLDNVTGVTSRRLSWVLAVNDSLPVEVVTSRLREILREGERVFVVACSPGDCVRLAGTSPGDGQVELVPWPEGEEPPDWRLLRLGGRQLTLLAPFGKELTANCTSPLIGAYLTPENETRLCGYVGQMLTLIATKINCTYATVRKGGCGVLQSDGSMSGRPSWLRTGRGDLGAGTCTVDERRSRAVHMGEWFWSDATSIGTAQPGHAHSDFLVFGVLQPELWALLAAYVVFYAALLWLTQRVAHAVVFGRRRVRNAKHQQDNSHATIRHCRAVSANRRSAPRSAGQRGWMPGGTDYLQQSVRMFLGQGDDVTSQHLSSRLIMTFIYMSTITVMSVYAGNLTAFFSIQRYQPPVDSLEQLAASPLEPHVTYGQSHYYLFENATSGARGTIWRKMSACSGCVHDHWRTTGTMEFVSAIVRGERSLFQSSRSILRRADQYLERLGQRPSALCPLRVARQAIRRDFYALQFPHYSRYSALFDETIRWLRYYGVIQRIFRQVAANKCSLTAPLEHETAPLDMHRLQGAFLMWGAGMAAALLLVLAECVFARCRRWNQNMFPEKEIA